MDLSVAKPEHLEIPDSITIAEFMRNEQYGRYPVAESRNPYTCGLTGKTYSAAEVVKREDWMARAIAKRLGFDTFDRDSTEWDKVVGLFSFNTVSGSIQDEAISKAL